MKQQETDKYNIAWFKLAEFVSRGEKEKALGLYKLLSHSFNDSAFSKQLEADLLWAFNDPEAISRYVDAAILYKNNNRMLEAAGVYEHLITLADNPENYIIHAIDLFTELKYQTKIVHYYKLLIESFLKKDELKTASNTLKTLDKTTTTSIAYLHKILVIKLLKTKTLPKECIVYHIHKSIDGFFSEDDYKNLQTLLSELEALKEEYYTEACDYMKKGNIEL